MNVAQANASKEAGNHDYTNQNFESALRHYSLAVQLDPTNHVHFSNRSACYFSMKKYKEALRDSEECIRLKADWPRGYLRKGKALNEMGRHREAIETLKRGLDLDPSNDQFQSALHQCEEKKKHSISELFTGEKLARLRSHPKTASFFSQPDFLLLVDRATKNPDDTAGMILDPRVMTCFQTNMEMELESIKSGAFEGINSLFKDGQLGGMLGKAGIPRPDFMGKPKAEPQIPKPADPPQRDFRREAEEAKSKGNEEYKLQHFPEAIAFYEQAISLFPSEPVYYTNKATALFEMGDLKHCVAVCEEAISKAREGKADPAKLAKAFARKGNAYRRLNQAERALESFREAVRLQPDPALSQQIADIEAALPPRPAPAAYSEPSSLSEHAEKCNSEGSAAFKNQHYSEAEQKYSEAIDLNPGESKYWANRAAARIKEGNLPGALRDVDKSIQLNAGVAKVWNRKAFIHREKRDYCSALDAYAQALSIGNSDDEAANGFVSCAQSVYGSMSAEAKTRAAALLSQEDVRSVMEGAEGAADAVAAPETRDKVRQVAKLV